MPLPKRLFADDEELGKKNDDHRPKTTRLARSALRMWRSSKRKRILLGLLALWLLYLFFTNIPTDVPPVSQRFDARFSTSTASKAPQSQDRSSPSGPPPRTANTAAEHYYEGPIKFYDLSSSLHHSMGATTRDRYVLFAASSLKSVSSLISLACDMSKQNRNRVHFAIMGRDEISIDSIKNANGINDADCAVRWHDGRPDYSHYSSDARMEFSVRASLGHIITFMDPQVILTDSAIREDVFFSRAIDDKTSELGITSIELPLNAGENLQWISKLEGASLKAWNNFHLEILIHAPRESSGSLIRLLKSLETADYFGCTLPWLTIELPAHIDLPTSNFLSEFRWPPHSNGVDSKLTLRRRIHSSRLTASEASIRTIESFYPANPPASHILVLTPQAELSPTYYHYLIYTLLEYRYSASAARDTSKILGVSLHVPTKKLNNKHPLPVPQSEDNQGLAPFFLWQAPNSDAALYFGEKWVELHSFLTNRFTIDSGIVDQNQDEKLVSEKYPSWMEYFLELTRTRGYTMLYPSFATRAESALVTIHNELYQPPEEFSASKAFTSDTPDTGLLSPAKLSDGSDVLTAQSEAALRPNKEITLTSTTSLLSLIFTKYSSSLDEGGAYVLPRLSRLPLLAYDGQSYIQANLDEAAADYSEKFSLQFGGCRTLDGRGPSRQWSTDDLFCLEAVTGN